MGRWVSLVSCPFWGMGIFGPTSSGDGYVPGVGMYGGGYILGVGTQCLGHWTSGAYVQGWWVGPRVVRMSNGGR